jgi:hypothetical protein
MSDEMDILTLVTEARAKILRGEDVSLEELRQALAAVRKARAALVGAKPKRKSSKAKMEDIFDDSGQAV